MPHCRVQSLGEINVMIVPHCIRHIENRFSPYFIFVVFKCSLNAVAGGSEMTCHRIRSNVRHIGNLHLVSILQLLLIPRYRLRTFGHRAFAVAGPTFWNSLADELRTYSSDRFKLALKTFLFATY